MKTLLIITAILIPLTAFSQGYFYQGDNDLRYLYPDTVIRQDAGEMRIDSRGNIRNRDKAGNLWEYSNDEGRFIDYSTGKYCPGREASFNCVVQELKGDE